MSYLYALFAAALLALPSSSPQIHVQSHGPVQGAWLYADGYQLTIQKGPTYSAAIMLYHPDSVYPDAVVWDMAGRPRLQRGS